MDEFSHLFDLDYKHRILICLSCQYAIVPSQARTHLQIYHKRVSLQQRKEILSKVEAASELARIHQDVIYPAATDPPLASLPTYFDGLKCHGTETPGLACSYICRTVYGMRKHCRQKHSWINEQKRGGDSRKKQMYSQNKIWTENHTCQRFFKASTWQRYFEVAQHDVEESEQQRTDRTNSFFRLQEDDIRQAEHDATKDANRVHGFKDHVSAVVPWLRETGIAKHIQSLRKDEIRTGIATPPLGDKSNLRTIIDAMQSLLQDAHRLCFDGPDCMLTYQCRVVLSRFQSSQVDLQGKTRPFDPYKGPKSLETYFGTAYRFVSYFSRVAAPDEYHFSIDTEDGDDMQRPEDIIEATDEQLAVWQDIQQIVQRTRTSTTEEDEHAVNDTEDREKLKDRLLKLWMLLICHTTGARRYKSPLLSFCAMLSIKPSTKSWMEPGNFNSSLSAIIWVVQLLIFYDSALKEQQGYGKTLDLVKACCDNYLQQTVETPMGEILRWRLLLFKVSGASVGTHEVSWDESEEVLTYEDIELRMDQIPSLLASEYQGCCQLLYDDLMLGLKDLRRMSPHLLKDGVNVDTVRWNFTQHRDNATTLNGTERALTKAIERSEQLCRIFLVQDDRSSAGWAWRESAMASYEATVQEFLKRLSVLIHISGGQPIRESEFFSMTYRNTQRRRSIIIRFDRVMVHVQYHKGQQQTGNYKDNVRFLAQPIAELLLDYIVYVLPLRERFLRQTSPGSLLSPYLWEKDGKVWPEGRLSRYLEEACARACVPRLHVANWRQISVAIVKTKFASQIDCFDPDEGDEDAEEMDATIRGMTEQRNHKTRTVNRAYANQTGAVFSNLWDGKVRMGLQASTLWQDFLGVETILKQKKRGRVEQESRLMKRVAIGIYRPRKPWSTEALLRGVKKLYGDKDVGWKSTEQEQALAKIMSWTEQVVAILPTGAGKSLLFMLPCTLPDARTTILIVPLVALHTDMLRRVREMKIDHLEWQLGESREAALVLVSAEAASSKDFMKYARRLVREQKLDRIVVDECHLTVTAAEYRPSMTELTAIRSLRTQFVYLTATLPPCIRAEFEERNYLHRPTVIRASSNRPNIFYMVRKADTRRGSLIKQAAIEATDAWTESGLFDHARDKIILYVRTRKDADDLADLLDCDAYTAESGTPAERKKILDRWIQTIDTPYIVATTALAEGFDHPHVRLVMNVDEPESLIVFAQESGRAGRDGKRAYSMVLLPPAWQARAISDLRDSQSTSNHKEDRSLRKLKDKQAVYRYLQSEQCYRTSLSDFLDMPQHRRWCMTEDVLCDVCKVAHKDGIEQIEKAEEDTAHTGLQIMQQERLREQSELTQYRLDLAGVKGTCLLCRAIRAGWDHSFSTCPRRFEVFEERNKARQRHEGRGRKWIQPYTSCFWCLNPQSICQQAELGGRRRGECEHRDVVLPLCFGVFQSAEGLGWLEERFGREFEVVEDYFDWLGEECKFGGGSAIQAVRVAGLWLQCM
jgi:superfamily II DNA helicase RecQ